VLKIEKEMSQTGMSDPNKWYDRRNGNSHTAKIQKIHLTILGKDFSSNLFSQSFTDKNHGKVKNRRT
jgi:hypothetical protein